MNSLSRSLLENFKAKHNSRPGLTLATLALLLVSQNASAEWVGEARPLMGTEVSVYLWNDDPHAGQVTVEAVFREAERIDRLMSTYKSGSKISEINRQAAENPVAAGAELFTLIERSLQISEETQGAFDITYESVGQYFDFRQRSRPDDTTIGDALRNIDYRFVQLDPEAQSVRFAQDGVRINLGGIAKGYVVERGIEMLRARGIRHGIVTAGGDTRLLGDRRGRPWMVGIRHPRKDGEVAMQLPLVDEAISTSGDYERFFEEDGIRYHHIIHPDTGRSVDALHSATVMGPDAVMTDALSTSVFVLGVEEGMRLIASMPAYESVIIDADGQVFFSDGLAPPVASPSQSVP